ncbi:MAG TPA: hypothetical protein ENH29_10830 [Bacteroidetes bacterium]|nr:hypothetical protein [Bacteroidota bacterium]
MKKLIHVSCTSAYKYPERPQYLLVRGKKYTVISVLAAAKIQTAKPPFNLIHSYRVELKNGRIAEIQYEEQKGEWYLLNAEDFDEE